jgi:hypothetical protein
MLPDMGRLSLRGAPKMTSAPLSTATDARTRESTSGDAAPESPKPKPRAKKQKADPNEPSAEEKQAAYAAQHAKAEHDARIAATKEALEEARKVQFEVVGKLLSSGGTDDELNARVEEAEAKVTALEAELTTLEQAEAPVCVDPERMPWQTEAQQRIQELQKKRDRNEEEDAELEALRGAGKKQLTDKQQAKKDAQALARAENKMAHRQEAIDNPSRAEKLFAKNEGEMKWWKTMGRHLSSQKAKHIRDGRVEELAVAMRRGPPPAPPPARRGIVWPSAESTTTDDLLLQLVNAQLESLGLAAVEARRRAHAAEEARLAPVREQLDRDDADAKQAAKEAKVKKANSARDAKAQAATAAAKEMSESRAGAIAQGAKDAQARSAELARQDALAQAALHRGTWQT